MKRFLLTLYIIGIVIYIRDYLGFGFDPITLVILTILLPLTVIALNYVKLIENPEKQKAMLARHTVLLRDTEVARKAAGISAYNSVKRSYPIVISIVSLVIAGYALLRIIEKANRGMFFFGRFTFIFGVIQFATMVVILIVSCRKKEKLFVKANIRKNAYLYLNAIIGLMLIAK